MKKNILSAFLTISLFSAYGQIVNETVDFNNYVSSTDNDFVNRFNNGLGLTQITTSGITGGCLTVPATMDWGNDNAVYCSKYISDSGSYCRTSVSFKYDTTVFSTSGFDRAVSIFLHPYADFNHYVIASVSHTHRIEILTYSWTNSPGPLLNLVHNHWYDLILTVTFTGGPSGDQVDVNTLVTDLGTTGQTPPIPVNSSSGTFNDSVLVGDTAVRVSFTVTGNGGAKYIDNFRYEGIKSADSCISIPTYIFEKTPEDFSVFISGNKLTVGSSEFGDKSEITIYSIRGEKIFSQKLIAESRHQDIDISGWTPGVYFVCLKTMQSASVKKIALVR